jgi:hypothetical protein
VERLLINFTDTSNSTNKNRVLIFFIIIGFLASLVISWQRHNVESANVNVEIIMSYDDIASLAHKEGVLPASLFSSFKEAGVTTLSINETTLEKLEKEGKVFVVSGTKVLEINWQNIAWAVDPKDVYVSTEDKDVFEELKADLIQRLGPERVKSAFHEKHVLALKADYETIMEMRLGLSSSELKKAVEYGFYVVPRPSNYVAVTVSDIDAVFKRIAVIDKKNVSAIVFTASQALGFPDLLPETALRLRETGFRLGLIEHPVQLQFFRQDGLLSLATAIDYNVIRLYNIYKGEQLKLESGEASRRFGNSDRERNLRLNLLHSFERPEPGKTLIETNLDYVKKVKAALLMRGFNLAQTTPFEPYFPSRFLLVLVVLGISSGITLLLANILPMKTRWQYLAAFFIAIILVFPILKGAGTTARQLASLAAICCFPVLAVTYMMEYWQRLTASKNLSFIKLIIFGSLALIVTTILSLFGGIYAGAVLSDIRFFLEIEIFRGVKLSLVAPLALISLVYLTKFHNQNNDNEKTNLGEKIERILNYPILVKTLAFAGAALVVAYVFLGRSGHTAGVPVPGFEIKMRLFLEEFFYARPRGKEFLIGHPAFLLFLGALRFNLPKFWQYMLLVAATIGQSSVAQTFAHMRSPVYLSIMRGLDGMMLGLIIALFALVGFYFVMRFTSLGKKERGET